MTLESAAQFHAQAQEVAWTMKAVKGCEGMLIRQPNEPAGGQQVYHDQMHLISRYTGDLFDFTQKKTYLS